MDDQDASQDDPARSPEGWPRRNPAGWPPPPGAGERVGCGEQNSPPFRSRGSWARPRCARLPGATSDRRARQRECMRGFREAAPRWPRAALTGSPVRAGRCGCGWRAAPGAQRGRAPRRTPLTPRPDVVRQILSDVFRAAVMASNTLADLTLSPMVCTSSPGCCPSASTSPSCSGW